MFESLAVGLIIIIIIIIISDQKETFRLVTIQPNNYPNSPAPQFRKWVRLLLLG